MGDNTAISWTDATWNPTRGCTRVSAGCENCYAERVAARFSGPGQPYEGLATKINGHARWTNQVRLLPDKLNLPLHWQRPRRIFVDSMSDLFHEDVPFSFIMGVFDVMRQAKQHTFQILTKRPARMRDFMNRWYQPLPNVWCGTSVEDQRAANQRIPYLVETEAAVRFLSCEPLIGAVSLQDAVPCGYYCDEAVGHVDHSLSGLHWVIVGGESGHGYRPMETYWLTDLVAECQRWSIPVFVKQGSSSRSGQQGAVPNDLWTLKEFPRV